MDPIYGIFIVKNLIFLGKTWNVAIRKVYNVQFPTHCRFLQHVSQLNHVTHMLKSRIIKFMVANLVGKNKHVAYVANLYFRNAMPVLVGILIK